MYDIKCKKHGSKMHKDLNSLPGVYWSSWAPGISRDLQFNLGYDLDKNIFYFKSKFGALEIDSNVAEGLSFLMGIPLEEIMSKGVKW